MLNNNSETTKNIPKAQLLGLNDTIYQAPKMSIQTEKTINQVKRRDRPIIKLDQWSKDNFYVNGIIKQLFDCPDQVDRKQMETFSIQQFKEQYHRAKKAVIIKGCTVNWKEKEFWSHKNLVQLFENQLFKVGQDDDGQKIRIKMSTFIDYLVHNTDDSPLYLFENMNIVSQELKPIIESYQVPQYFSEDVYKLLEDKDRPLFRWFLMGPQRSGSTVHIDPLMTSAWNTSLVGHKRWVLFHQDTPRHIVKGKEFRQKGYVDQAINYFTEILPHIKKKYSKQTLGIVEFIQNPGQTVFVPSGVWHAVINLDDTVAVTQNFMNEVYFQDGWEAILEQKKSFAPVLLEKIKQKYPQLYAKTLKIGVRKEEDLSESEKYVPIKEKKMRSHSFQQTDKQSISEAEQITPRLRVYSDSIIRTQRPKQKTFSQKGTKQELLM